MDKFVDLVDYLKRESRDDFYLSFERIEEIIGQPLSQSAKTYPAYWSADGVHHLAMLILECGFKVSPDLANQRIRLYRYDSNNTFLTTSVTSYVEMVITLVNGYTYNFYIYMKKTNK